MNGITETEDFGPCLQACVNNHFLLAKTLHDVTVLWLLKIVSRAIVV